MRRSGRRWIQSSYAVWALFVFVMFAAFVPAASGSQPPGPSDRITICHEPGTPAQKTLTLPRKAAEKHIANHGDTLGACSDSENEVTQTFSDLESTPPQDDEITAPPVDLDSSFPPPGPSVPPGPPVLVDAHFFDLGGAIEELQLPGGAEERSTSSAAAAPGGEGRWIGPDEGIPQTGADDSGNVAIHAALLRTKATPTGADSGAEILWFAGDAHDPTQNIAGEVNHTGVYKILNPIQNQFHVEKISSPPVDLFCAGHAQLEDGRLLVAGGTDRFPANVDPRPRKDLHKAHFLATPSSFTFNPKTNRWSDPSRTNFEPGPDFTPLLDENGNPKGGGRWYPTLSTLNSGRVLAFWGHPNDDDSRHTNNTPEIFMPGKESWEFLGRETDVSKYAELGYPRVHLLPNGRVFRATPVADRHVPDSTMNVEINPIPQSLTDPDEISVKVSGGPGAGYPTSIHYPSVLLPLTPDNKYKAQILLTGDTEPVRIELGTNTEDPRQSWTFAGTREIADRRFHANATILPTGEVFVSGGRSELGGSLEETAVTQGEIYDPFTGEWRTVASTNVKRDYHSVALLMPDGRVWHAGTSIDGRQGLKLQKEEVDIYEPWYYDETRPVIHSMTGPEDPVYPDAPMMHPHDRVTVAVDHSRDIEKFALVRAGSATHAFNPDQRYIELEKLRRAPIVVQPPDLPAGVRRRVVILKSPPSSSIAPPGNYMLFAIDDRGVPSVGRFIRIDRQFVGELKQEAEDLVSESGTVFVRDGTVSLQENFKLRGFPPRFTRTRPIIEYGGIDFGTEEGIVRQFSTRLALDFLVGGVLEVRLDRPDGQLIATLDVPPTRGFVELDTSLTTPVSGVHNVFIMYRRPFPILGAPVDVDWFKFKQ